jgi:hypothetical protein
MAKFTAISKNETVGARRADIEAPNDEKSSSVNSGRCVTRRVTGIVELVDRTVTVAGTTICRMEMTAKNKKTMRS